MSWPMRSPADASPPPLRMARRTAWGQCGSLLLHCSGLAPPTPCRSLPALGLEPRTIGAASSDSLLTCDTELSSILRPQHRHRQITEPFVADADGRARLAFM